MRLIKEEVSLSLPAALSFAGAGDERVGLCLNLPTDLVVQAVAGASQIEITGVSGQFLPAAVTEVMIKSAHRVLDYLGASQVGFRVSGVTSWPLASGPGIESILAVAGTWLVASMLPEGTLSEPELLELAVQSGARPELAVALMRGDSALVWTLDAGRGVRYLPLGSAGVPVTMLVPVKNGVARGGEVSRLAARSDAGQVKNFGLFALMCRQGQNQVFADLKHWLKATESAVGPAAGQLTQVVEFLRGRLVPAVTDSFGELVFVPHVLEVELAEQARASGWRVCEAENLSEGVQVVANLPGVDFE